MQKQDEKRRGIWGVTTQKDLRELFEAMREHRSWDHEEEIFDDEDADCVCD